MAGDPHDNEADDRAMLRKLRDQGITVNNDDERDYDEEQYNRHLLDDETNPDEETWVQYYDPETGVPVDPPDERSRHRTQALRLAGLAERSDPEYATGPGLAAVTRALLALPAPAEPDHNWRQRAVEAEAALTAIGGIVISYQNFPSEIDLVGEIERILRTSGRKAKGFTVHTGMLAHDGFLPHSHEVRPDHYSVPRDQAHVHPRDRRPHIPHAHPGGHLPHDHQDEDL